MCLCCFRKQCLLRTDHLGCKISIKMASQPCGGQIINKFTQFEPSQLHVLSLLTEDTYSHEFSVPSLLISAKNKCSIQQ